MGAGSKLAKYKCDWPDCAKYLSRPDALARHRRRHIEKMRQQQERLAGKNERG
ncbi:hypothetical protein FA95DRAFT_1561789 [Auriscalpium vulgare]|uniref:Uncharacterized protein n=1 Tax=Auriscalpium vulgare TaxID=40419 RepID=A0ACB8RMS6_9AGAM|nr:hypothetical protein FA95DRAFT_1561789 [Auriscalpium vulgare]